MGTMKKITSTLIALLQLNFLFTKVSLNLAQEIVFKPLPTAEPRIVPILDETSFVTGQVGGIVNHVEYFNGLYYVASGSILSIYADLPTENADPIFRTSLGRQILDLTVTDQ